MFCRAITQTPNIQRALSLSSIEVLCITTNWQKCMKFKLRIIVKLKREVQEIQISHSAWIKYSTSEGEGETEIYFHKYFQRRKNHTSVLLGVLKDNFSVTHNSINSVFTQNLIIMWRKRREEEWGEGNIIPVKLNIKP